MRRPPRVLMDSRQEHRKEMLKTPYFTARNRLTLVHNGQEFIDTCCALVEQAREKVFFHTYAFAEDEVTRPFVEALIAKAAQGVPVFVLIDAIGSKDISRDLRRRFDASGVRFAYFAPIVSRRLVHVGRRLHQKALVIDNHKALVGGINHGELFIKSHGRAPWLDYAALLEGEEVYRLQNKIRRLYVWYFPDDRDLINRIIREATPTPDAYTMVRANVNDFMRFKSEVYRSHIRAVRQARHSIQILASYFLPGKRLLKELKRAARRGVNIELIFGASSDHPTERWCSRYLYDWYLKNNITLYEWPESVLHAKVTVVDDEWVTLGSYNHNYLSRYFISELNLEVLNRGFASELRQEIESIKQRCTELTRDRWTSSTTVWQTALYVSTYMLLNLLTFVATVTIIRHKDRDLNR